LAQSYQDFSVTGQTVSTLTISLAYLETDDLSVYVNGVKQTTGWAVSSQVVTFTPAITGATLIRVMRNTDADAAPYIFKDGALFNTENIDTDFQAILYVAQETKEQDALQIAAITTVANDAVTTAMGASSAATAALSAANTAVATAGTATATANGVDAKATTALANSSAALTTANAVAGTTTPNPATLSAGTLTGAESISVLQSGNWVSSTVSAISNFVKAFFSASSGASLVGFIQNGTGAVTQTVQSALRENASVVRYGADPTGVSDSTAAFVNALAANNYVYVPSGTYILSAPITVPAGGCLYGAGASSILKRVAAGTNTSMVVLSTGATVRDLAVDGLKASQTVGCYGVLGYQVSNAKCINVQISNCYGIGHGWSQCLNCLCENVTVTASGNLSPGFWNGGGASSSYGNHTYNNCTSTGNDLDGIILNCSGIKIIGGNYSGNGVGAITGGALGAAGIYSDSSSTIDNIYITGVKADNNTEHGIDVGIRNSRIIGNQCNLNQLGGISLRGDTLRTIVSSNICANNGWYTGSLNPTIWTRDGIVFYPGASFLQIYDNSCYDDSPGTQQYGIRFASDSSSSVSSNNFILNNNCRFNTIDYDNVNPAGYTQTNLTTLIYTAGVWNSGSIPTSSSATPDVSFGIRNIRVSGSSITNFLNGSNGQIITAYLASGSCTFINSATLRLQGNTNYTTASVYMTNITFMYMSGCWYETGRCVYS